jgi:hypothetical protein
MVARRSGLLVCAIIMVSLWPTQVGGVFGFFERLRGGSGSEQQLYEAAAAADTKTAQTLLEADTDPDKYYGEKARVVCVS